MSKFYNVPCETICRSEVWHHISDPPNVIGFPIWGFFPEIGNKDEGWGHVEVVYCDLGGGVNRKWCNRWGVKLDPEPLMWAWIHDPIVPIISEDQETAREKAIIFITKPAE